MRIKICGLTGSGNAVEVAACGADYAGFIFYPGSKRYIGDLPDPELFSNIPEGVNRVGVFVGQERHHIVELAHRHRLHFVQLHGSEDPAECAALQATGIRVIKAFGIGTDFNFQQLQDYAACCDYFLFDTQTPQHGGSGLMFSWDLLQSYTLEIPFFLSGGIGPDDAGKVLSFQHPQLHAVDVNSRFESSPGVKDVKLVQKFIQELKSHI